MNVDDRYSDIFLVCLQASILIKTSRHYNDMDGLIHIVVSNSEKHVKQSEKYKLKHFIICKMVFNCKDR